MSARDLIQEALHSLEANKGRSLLTILGIVIGIASVIAMTSLIGGIQNSLVNSLGLNAARMVQIYSSQELTESDIEKLQKLVPQIEQIGIVDSAYTEYKTGDKSYTVMAQGVDSDMLDAVGASPRIVGVSGRESIANGYVAAHPDRVGDVGYDGNVNYERLLSLRPDLVLLFGVNGASPMEPKLRELGIPFCYIGEYLEESPLGKAVLDRSEGDECLVKTPKHEYKVRIVRIGEEKGKK